MSANTPDQDPTYDVAIVGGGLAGSLAATTIGRGDLAACLIDPHREFSADFRCEALTQEQIDRFAKAGLRDEIASVTTASRGMWIARHGEVVERNGTRLYGISYRKLVMRLREQVPSRIPIIEGNVGEIVNGPDRQTLTLTNGRTISARLVILASGANARLRRGLGMTHTVFSPTHSVSLGFDCRPAGGGAFGFPALTYYSDATEKCAAYMTLFPIDAGMRGNLFVYRGIHDPWLKQFQRYPRETLCELIPNLQDIIGSYDISGPVQMRPVDLYEMSNVMQDGVVLIGDAFANSCPAAGTGVDKILVDVERLCTHLPHWFASAGMSAEKIHSFYTDPIKTACDDHSHAHAFYTRNLAINDSLVWNAIRFASRIARYLVKTPHQQSGWKSRLHLAAGRRAPA